jgi:geranylgeranyl diphosphate synthase type II
LGGALERNQNLLYEFGRKLGLAFQVQDDYLDAFGDAEKFGKQVGGDIKSNKKTFSADTCAGSRPGDRKKELEQLLESGRRRQGGKSAGDLPGLREWTSGQES